MIWDYWIKNKQKKKTRELILLKVSARFNSYKNIIDE